MSFMDLDHLVSPFVCTNAPEPLLTSLEDNTLKRLLTSLEDKFSECLPRSLKDPRPHLEDEVVAEGMRYWLGWAKTLHTHKD